MRTANGCVMKVRRVDAGRALGGPPGTVLPATAFAGGGPAPAFERATGTERSLCLEEKQAVPRRRNRPSSCRMLGCLFLALASGLYVADMLFTSDTVADATSGTEASPAPKAAVVMPPDRDDRLDPIVNVVPPGDPLITKAAGGLTSGTTDGSPTEAPPVAKTAAVVPSDRGTMLAPLVSVASSPGGPPITIVTGGQAPVEPVLATAFRADKRSTPDASSASDLAGRSSSADRAAENGLTLRPPEREEEGSLSTLANSTFAVQDGIDGPEGQPEPLMCVPCEAIFRQAAEAPTGAKVHNVTVQIRGEPKSGTTFMYEWAANALMVACGHIERMFGVGTCLVSFERAYTARAGEIAPITANTTTKDMKQLFLEFDPKRWRGPVSSTGTAVGAACPCENLDKAIVSVRSHKKHSFPVNHGCPWQHIDNVTPAEAGCSTIDSRNNGRRVENHSDTTKCFDANPCEVIGDDREQQMLILRDPRAVTTSTYFYLKPFPNAPAHPIVGETIDDFVVRMMPTICRYMHIRYLLLSGQMRDRTTEFLYDESWADPLTWHRTFFSMVGLSPLDGIVEEAADTAIRRDFEFNSPGVNAHRGGAPAVKTRTWKDEVSASLKDQMDDLCRVWLPPVLMKTLGILS